MMPSSKPRASTAPYGRARPPAEPPQVPDALVPGRTIPANKVGTADHLAESTQLHTRGHDGQKGRAPAPNAPQKLLVTVPEVCRMLSIGRSLAYELIAQGVIPSVRLGERRVLVPVAALQEQIAVLMGAGR